MSTTGDDDRAPQPPVPPTPQPGGQVEPPRFGETGPGQYEPHYAGAPQARPAHPPVPPPPPSRPGGAVPPPTRDDGSRTGLIAPIAAAVVLVVGVAVLVLNSGSDDADTITMPEIPADVDTNEPTAPGTSPNSSTPDTAPDTADDTVVETDAPEVSTVETTTPAQTSPPLLGTTPIAVETTLPPAEPDPPPPGGPTQAELDGALLGLGDLGSGDWTVEEPGLDDFCATDPNSNAIDVRSDAFFQNIVDQPTADEPVAIRQITHSLISYPDEATAAAAFTAETDAALACDATTQDVDGTSYRVQVDSSPFTDEQVAAMVCGDQSALLISQFTNDDATIAYIGRISWAFRCGRNISIAALATTIGVDDLDDEAFTLAVVTASVRASSLPGSG